MEPGHRSSFHCMAAPIDKVNYALFLFGLGMWGQSLMYRSAAHGVFWYLMIERGWPPGV